VTTSAEVTWQLDEITMCGTLTRPEGEGPHPAARLLADAFAEADIASLRYDKRVSGPHAAETIPRMIGRVSMQSHLDELVAAVAVLASQRDTDASRVVGLGNSEGTLHVLHYATST
jgi:uncharacterized protein